MCTSDCFVILYLPPIFTLGCGVEAIFHRYHQKEQIAKVQLNRVYNEKKNHHTTHHIEAI